MQLKCKVIKKWQPLHYLPFLAKLLVPPPQMTKFLEGLIPPPTARPFMLLLCTLLVTKCFNLTVLKYLFNHLIIYKNINCIAQEELYIKSLFTEIEL